MIPTFILPGLNGSPENHWQRHWAKDHAEAHVIEQEDWNCPVLDDWQAELDKALSTVEGAFLVAHSLGCLLAASYAGRSIAAKIKGALLVAPCSLDVTLRLHPCMVDFGEEQLTRLPFPSLVIGSLNDPYMTVTELERHVLAWGSELTTIGFAGHINVASGFGQWTEGYVLFERLVRAARRSRWPIEQVGPAAAVQSSLRLTPRQGSSST